MLSHTNDHTPVITPDNYEEYFLLYVDNELSATERSMVEAFLQFHPELQAELNLLMGAKLEPEADLGFGFKGSLMADQIRSTAADETLLLHIDNELPAAQKAAVEMRLEQDAAYRAEHNLLLRTKSDPAEQVPYPNKEELYRHTVHLMRFAYAWRIAAALLLLASMGLVWWMQRGPAGTETQSVVAVQTKQNVKPGTLSPATQAVPRKNQPVQDVQNRATQEVMEAQAAPENEQQLAQAPVQRKQREEQKVKVPVQKQLVPLPEEVQQPQQVIAFNDPALPSRNADGSRAMGINAEKNNFNPGVTSQPLQTYTNTEAAAEPTFASSREGEGRTNLKVLLRKATRLVERRAHINATNDDEELLIGAVAIKLK